jgi:hypothetical protein
MRCHLPLVLGAGLLAPALLDAQILTELANRNLRWDCAQAVASLKAGWMTSEFDWALATVPLCGDDGIGALARVWQNPPRDTVRLERLVSASTQFADQRILASVTALAMSPREPTLVRLEALRVLAFYANPALYVSLGQLDPRWIAEAPGFLQRGDGFTGREGSQPLDAEARERALETIRWLAENDRDERIRMAAAYLATGIESLRSRR